MNIFVKCLFFLRDTKILYKKITKKNNSISFFFLIFVEHWCCQTCLRLTKTNLIIIFNDFVDFCWWRWRPNCNVYKSVIIIKAVKSPQNHNSWIGTTRQSPLTPTPENIWEKFNITSNFLDDFFLDIRSYCNGFVTFCNIMHKNRTLCSVNLFTPYLPYIFKLLSNTCI